MNEFTRPSFLSPGEKEPVYPEATYISTLEIPIDGDEELRPIDFFIMPNAPKPGSFWYERVARFYTTGLGDDAKMARFHTIFDSFSEIGKERQKVLLGIDGRHTYYCAIDRQTTEIVGHASRTNYKKDDSRLCEVAIATASSNDYLRKGIAKNLLTSIVEDAMVEEVLFLELNTDKHNKPVNALNESVIKAKNLIAFKIPDPFDSRYTLTFMHTNYNSLSSQIDKEEYVIQEILHAMLDSEICLAPEARELIANSGLRLEAYGRQDIEDRITKEVAAKTKLIKLLKKYHPSFKPKQDKKRTEPDQKKPKKDKKKSMLGILPDLISKK